MTEQDLTQQDVVEKLRNTKLAMLTTALPDGTLLSHPMSIQGVSEDVDVWFFLALDGGQADALRGDPHVNLAVAEAGSWLSVAGRARLVEDRKRPGVLPPGRGGSEPGPAAAQRRLRPVLGDARREGRGPRPDPQGPGDR